MLVFPTHVGMDRSERRTEMRAKGIPHTRGDGPRDGVTYTGEHMYSPHTWGWTAARAAAVGCGAVFPTHVGMDRDPGRHYRAMHRIPHTRGDGPWRRPLHISGPWYSPHTWGWTVYIARP